MLKLYGYPISNFYNKVKLALLEKNLEFSEERVRPGRRAEVLQHSPYGLIPYLEHAGNFFFESTVILEYLEAAFPEAAHLYPIDAVKSARVRMLMSMIDFHLDPKIRPLYDILRGKSMNANELENRLPEIHYCTRAINQFAKFDGFIAGTDEYSAADCSALATLPHLLEILKELDQADIVKECQSMASYLDRMQERPASRKVTKGMRAAARALKMLRARA